METVVKGPPQMKHTNKQEVSNNKRPKPLISKPKPEVTKKKPVISQKPPNLLNRQLSQEDLSKGVIKTSPKPLPKACPSDTQQKDIPPNGNNYPQAAKLPSHVETNPSLARNVDIINSQQNSRAIDLHGDDTSDSLNVEQKVKDSSANGQSTIQKELSVTEILPDSEIVCVSRHSSHLLEDFPAESLSLNPDPNVLSELDICDHTTNAKHSKNLGSNSEFINDLESNSKFKNSQESISKLANDPESVPIIQTKTTSKIPPKISPKPKKPNVSKCLSNSFSSSEYEVDDSEIKKDFHQTDSSQTGTCQLAHRTVFQNQSCESPAGSVLSKVHLFNSTNEPISRSPSPSRRKPLPRQPGNVNQSYDSPGLTTLQSDLTFGGNAGSSVKTQRSQSFQSSSVGVKSVNRTWINKSVDSVHQQSDYEQNSEDPVHIEQTLVKSDSPAIQRSKSAVTRTPPKPKPRISSKPVPKPRPRPSLGNTEISPKALQEISSSENLKIDSVEQNVKKVDEKTVVSGDLETNSSQEVKSKENEVKESDLSNITCDINANEKPDIDLTITPASPPPPSLPPKQTDISSKHKDIFSPELQSDDTSSLLQEIEKIVNNAFQFSLDSNSRPLSSSVPGGPVRPPRRKKFQNIDGECGADSDSELVSTRSNSDSFKGSTQSLSAISDNVLGRTKKPCPPKPERKKLRRVNRSKSDVTDIRQLLIKDKMSELESGERERNSTGSMPTRKDYALSFHAPRGVLPPDFCMPTNQEAMIRERMGRTHSLPASRKLRTRVDDEIDVLMKGATVDEKREQFKSQKHKVTPKRPAPPPPPNEAPFNEQRQSAKERHAGGHYANSSAEQKVMKERTHSVDSNENEYFEIPEDLWKGGSLPSSEGHEKHEHYSKEKSLSPPDLPPRKYDLNNPGRPVSEISTNSDSGSVGQGSQAQESSSEDEDVDEETRKERKRQKKIFYIAQEMMTSERVFVDVLQLLNHDFRLHISKATEQAGRAVIPSEVLNKILSHLPQLYNLNSDILNDLEDRITNWEKNKCVADIFVKTGPFLRLYISYIKDFSEMCAVLDDATKKMPQFQAALKEFEMSQRCACLAVRHYMLKPIQRIPQYKLMLQDYMKHLEPDSKEFKNTVAALQIVNGVADDANESMKQGDQVQKMLEIQKSLDGIYEVIIPGRIFLKSGELMKLSRKEMQPRMLFLFNDVLLYTMPNTVEGYKLKNALTLVGMRVTKNDRDEFKNEFSIISVQRSFTVEASTPEERDEWIKALNNAITEHAKKRSTFEKNSQKESDKDFVPGAKAPVWIPDSRVTMCAICTAEFSFTFRRHHCRACGKIVCYNCLLHKAPLAYLDKQRDKVCDECFTILKKLDPTLEENEVAEEETEHHGGSIFDTISGWFSKSTVRKRPHRLIEVPANDPGASISGTLKLLQNRKWKKNWFLVKDKILYTYDACEDKAAKHSMSVLGYNVERITKNCEGIHHSLLFQLKHKNTNPMIFQTENKELTEKWITSMKEASVP